MAFERTDSLSVIEKRRKKADDLLDCIKRPKGTPSYPASWTKLSVKLAIPFTVFQQLMWYMQDTQPVTKKAYSCFVDKLAPEATARRSSRVTTPAQILGQERSNQSEVSTITISFIESRPIQLFSF